MYNSNMIIAAKANRNAKDYWSEIDEPTMTKVQELLEELSILIQERSVAGYFIHTFILPNTSEQIKVWGLADKELDRLGYFTTLTPCKTKDGLNAYINECTESNIKSYKVTIRWDV